jgi:hypothetical protein
MVQNLLKLLPIQLVSIRAVVLLCLATLSFSGSAQNQGLEAVIVEEYYVADADDAMDVAFGAPPEGAVTYRVFLDLAPGYKLQIISGFLSNELSIETTTQFFNSVAGVQRGELLNPFTFNLGNTAIDSYITFGGGRTDRVGIPKNLDPDGSLVTNNTNTPPDNIPISVSDGLVPGTPASTGLLDLDLSVFGAGGGSSLSTTNGAFFNLNGVEGPTEENIVLIGQFTTDGEFSFKLNVQLFDSNANPEYYTHTNITDNDGIFSELFPGLIFPTPEIPGCLNSEACNYNPLATISDDSCIIPEFNCTQCNSDNTGLDLIDDDNDGVCNANEMPGCSSPTACNFDPTVDEANDDGSCIEPEANCTECNSNNDGLILIDDDGDGVCNAQEVLGCTLSGACNFNPNATEDDGTCTDLPTENCTTCEGASLVLIDDDGDGICNADEIEGCTNSLACNFDENATDDDGSCTDVPEENCTECNGEELVLIDGDQDGICDADEIAGCTSTTACNFDQIATDDDGSCIEPIENCQECNDANDGLDIVDSDSDGVCDADDICPFLPDLVNGDDCITGEGNPGTIANCNCETDIIEGCLSQTACNFDPNANLDDGSCIEPIENCFVCNEANDGLTIVDVDGDGVCDADEVLGCTSSTACNFEEEATEDDGSCIEPVPFCITCGPNGSIIFIDTDGDGICDADEIDGCTSITACNFDENATDDDGSCIEPVPNCEECNETNDGLVIVDTDGDGVCDAEEISGCTSQTACNFSDEATDDNGSCIEPIPNCEECNENNDGLVLIDSDGDGICDADEIEGCTSETACNFDESATDDDGSCIEPVENCFECNESNDGLDIIDSDGDGICDADEVPGCTDQEAQNYNPNATDDDGSCLYTVALSLLEINCDGPNAFILQATDAQEINTDGGQATRETRTIYAFNPDQGMGQPTYEGSAWPYVIAPVGFSVEDVDIAADVTVNDDNVLLINGWPAYQFTGDGDPSEANGNSGPWFYLTPEGELNQNPCVVSTEFSSIAENILVYPNPATNSFSVAIKNPKRDVFDMNIATVEGRILKKEQIIQGSNFEVHEFDVNELAPGVYILNLRSERNQFSTRLVIL